MHSPLRRRTLRPGRLDGLAVRVTDGPALSGVDLAHALRMLARMMVRSHQADGDREAMIPEIKSSSELTLLRKIAPHHDTNEAA